MIERLIPFTSPLLRWTVAMPLRFLFFRVKAEGLENIPSTGGAIVVANHLSNLDPGLVGVTISRKIRFMAKQELFWPVVGFLLKLHGDFPVRRLERDTAAVRKAQQVLEDGYLLGMFPEGTRSRSGQMEKAHLGSAFIALRSGAPVIPAGITGTEKASSPLTIVFKRPQVTINYGKPFYLEKPARMSAEAVEEATNTIMREVAKLLSRVLSRLLRRRRRERF